MKFLPLVISLLFYLSQAEPEILGHQDTAQQQKQNLRTEDKNKNNEKKQEKKAEQKEEKKKQKEEKTDYYPYPRAYPHANKDKPETFIKPEDFTMDDGDAEKYIFHEEIGEGAFSKVYMGTQKDTNQTVVLKRLKEAKPRSLNREIMILNALKNTSKHIVNLKDAIRNFSNNSALLVYDYVAASSFQTIAYDLSLQDLKYYLYQLALALEESHSRGIMHRDVKLANIIVDEEQKLLVLIDWGLGEFYHYEWDYSCRVGTKHYKAPEILLGNPRYDYAVDIWSFGAILAGLTFKKAPFFKGKENDEVLLNILKIRGTDNMWAYLEKYNLTLPERLVGKFENNSVMTWDNFTDLKNRRFATKDALDLLDKLLVYDHQVRLTAKELLAHRYFDDVRELYQN